MPFYTTLVWKIFIILLVQGKIKMGDGVVNLYAYTEDFYCGSLSFLLLATEAQYNYILGSSVGWHDELGKHSEGEHTFTEHSLKKLDVSEDVAKVLLENGNVPFWNIGDILIRLAEQREEY